MMSGIISCTRSNGETKKLSYQYKQDFNAKGYGFMFMSYAHLYAVILTFMVMESEGEAF